MDPVSQGVIGATLSQSLFRKEKIFPVGIAGFLSGMSADLDVFIRSSTDPLLFLEYHRQFTHSFLFVPIGALVASIFLFYFLKNYLSWKETYLACFFGYSTHALLDACTAYGTQLFWPFSSERIAWNNISIIDPLFTLPLIIFLVFACIKKSRLFIFLGLGWAFLYMSTAILQKSRAISLGKEIALSRGHSAKLLTVKPSFGNLFLWKSIYEFEGSYHVDAIRLSLNPHFCPGQKLKKLDLKIDMKDIDKNSQQALDVERFREFSGGYLSFNPDQKLVIDARYSLVPNQISPLWGIIINPQKKINEHVEWWKNETPNENQISDFLRLLYGDDCYKL